MSTEQEREIIKCAEEMFRAGATWTAMSAELGVSRDYLMRRLEPGYRDRMAVREREYYAKNFRTERRKVPRRRAMVDAYQQAPAPIPDCRDVTQRFFGDPIPGTGRSALEQKMARNG